MRAILAGMACGGAAFAAAGAAAGVAGARAGAGSVWATPAAAVIPTPRAEINTKVRFIKWGYSFGVFPCCPPPDPICVWQSMRPGGRKKNYCGFGAVGLGAAGVVGRGRVAEGAAGGGAATPELALYAYTTACEISAPGAHNNVRPPPCCCPLLLLSSSMV